MANVHPDEEVRSRAEKAEQDAQRLVTDIGLDRDLYDVLAAVDPAGLDERARRVLEKSLRDFRRSGVDRSEDERERLRTLSERETEVAQTFSKNIRDGVGEVVFDPEELAGLPEDFVAGHPSGGGREGPADHRVPRLRPVHDLRPVTGRPREDGGRLPEPRLAGERLGARRDARAAPRAGGAAGLRGLGLASTPR